MERHLLGIVRLGRDSDDRHAALGAVGGRAEMRAGTETPPSSTAPRSYVLVGPVDELAGRRQRKQHLAAAHPHPRRRPCAEVGTIVRERVG